MIEKNDDRVWLYSAAAGKYYLLAKGFTSLRETYRQALLETPNLFSPLCKREILYHTGQLEFEGFRQNDVGLDILLSYCMKRGNEAEVTFLIGNRRDAYGESFLPARKITGMVCIENPGTGEGTFGGKFKGKIIYTKAPISGVFDENTQQFAQI